MLESMKVREISLLDAQCKMNAKKLGDPECLIVAGECEDGRPNADCRMPFFLYNFFSFRSKTEYACRTEPNFDRDRQSPF